MALEGIAALSLAGSIIQLVDFTVKIGELTKAFRDNCGELPSDLQRIENLVNDFVPIARRLQDASTTSTNVLLQEQTLVSLLSGCIREAQEFKLILDSFKTTSQTGWSSFLLSLKATRRAGKIRNIEKALESYKSAMTLRIAEASLARQYVHITEATWPPNLPQRIYCRVIKSKSDDTKSGIPKYVGCVAAFRDKCQCVF
jgi:signal transduction histidine kinase